MSRFLERTRRFELHQGVTWGVLAWGLSYYGAATVRRNVRPSPHTAIPGNLQARLRNTPRAIAHGWEFPEQWVERWRRMSRTRGSRSSMHARLLKEITR